MLPNRRDRRKQTRLSFTPAPSSSPLRPEIHVRVDHPLTPSKRRRVVNDSESDSPRRQLSPDIARAIELSKNDENIPSLLQSPQSEIDQLPTPGTSSQVEAPGTDGKRQRHPRGVNFANPIQSAATRSSPDLQHNTIISDSDDVRQVLRSRRKEQNVMPSSVSSSESSEDSEEPPRPKFSRPPTVRSFLVGGTSGTAPIPRTQQKNTGHFSPPKKSARAKIDPSSSQEDTTNTREDLGRKSTRYNTRQRQREQETKNREEESESDAAPVTPSRKRISIRSTVNMSQEVEEDDSDVIITTPSRRCRISGRKKKPSEEDDDSMLEELATVEDQESKRQTRKGQGNSARTKRFQELLKLKQRRAGVIETTEDDEDEYVEEERDEHRQIESDLEDAVDESGSKDLDEYESDFIEDDGEIGVDLVKLGVPLELTGHANKKQYDYFKHAVEWMVHNKLDPAFERNDEIYEMAHKKLNDEYLGLAGSEFKSSVWTLDFIKALQSRPEISTMHVGLEIMEPKCQACNRSGHPAKWLITFSGPAYDPRSLEKLYSKDVNDSSSESNEETDEAEEKDERWSVGSVCCGNAEVTHSLYHWRFQLNATILEWLAMNKYTEPLQIVEREEWSRRKKEKFANKIVDGMVESGEMESLYKEFKENLNAAVAARAEKTQRGGWKGKRA